jgi:hypothetical protein
MSLETVENDEAQAQQGALVDYMASAAEAVSHIKGAKEDVELIVSLLGDEGTVVEDLMEALTTSGLPVNRIPLEPSAMPEELGEVEEAHLTSEGSLVVSLLDGQVSSFDLSVEENRGLLVSAMGDILPKLQDVLGGSYVLPELIIEEEPVEAEPLEAPEEVPPPVPEVEEEPGEVEGPPEEVLVEPEVEEPLEEEPEIPEPAMEEDVAAVPVVEEAELDEPVTEEPILEEPVLPEFIPDDQAIEAPEPTTDKPALPEKPVKPPMARDAQVKRLRRAVKRQRSSAQIEMDRVRRQREAQIRKLRMTNGMIDPYGEQGEGLLDKVKGLLSKRRRRR